MRPRVRSTLPVVEPVLLTAHPDAFNDPAWLFEPKYDGYRGLLYVTRRGCRFRSKRGNVLERFHATGRRQPNGYMDDSKPPRFVSDRCGFTLSESP